jgi:tetratricopeptide (TPR) repeat protein
LADSRIEELRKRLEKEPGSRLFAQLAEELRKAGELDEAVRVCRDGLQKQPSYHSARMTLARALLDSGDLNVARVEFEAVLKAAPDNILASRLLGECLEGLGDLAGARVRYRTTLALSPADKQVQGRLEAVEARLAAPVAPPPPPVSAAPPSPPAPAAIEEAPIPEFVDFDKPSPLEEEPKPIPLVAAEESFELEAAYEAPPTRIGTEVEQEFVDFEAQAPTVAPIEIVSRVPLMEELPEVTPASEPMEEPPHVQEPEAPQPVTELASPTLAEIYFSQGHPEKAVELYRQVVEREPANERARTRLGELEAMQTLVAEAPAPSVEAAPAASQAFLRGEARRAALWRTIRHLEGMLAAVRRG